VTGGPATGSAALAESPGQELLNTLARQARRVPLPVTLTSLAIAGLAWDRVPAALVLGWLGVVLGMIAVRYWVITRLAARVDRPEPARLRIVTGLSLVNGFVQGGAAFAFPLLDEVTRALITMILVGMASGTVASSVGYRPVFAVYAGQVLGLPALMWLLSGPQQLQAWTPYAVALLIAFLFVVLSRLASDTHAAFLETFDFRLAQADLNVRLRGALEQAEGANRAKTRFLASASHDLRQPLHALQLFGAALGMRPLDPKSREIVGKINDATQDLAHELDTLLDMSKLDAGIVRVERAAVDIGGLAARVVDTMWPVANRKGVALTVSVGEGVVADTDRSLADRIVRNLVDNAIKYTERGGVTVTVRRDAESVVLAVADTGRGIPDSERERIFEEFYQVGNAERDRRKGLGLGLSIVRRLTVMLDASIEIASEPGSGSTFTVRLPAASAVPPETADADPDAGAPVDFGGLHVLVIDDEPGVRAGTRMLLESLGCRVTDAAGEDEALAAVDAYAPPDVVLADMRLGAGGSGIRAVARLRELHPAVAALLVSGDTAPDRLLEAERAGIVLLHKPVPADLLIASIAASRDQGGG
jgi:signal transduction histidine kinase/CheY-like chemotaxis protein